MGKSLCMTFLFGTVANLCFLILRSGPNSPEKVESTGQTGQTEEAQETENIEQTNKPEKPQVQEATLDKKTETV